MVLQTTAGMPLARRRAATAADAHGLRIKSGFPQGAGKRHGAGDIRRRLRGGGKHGLLDVHLHAAAAAGHPGAFPGAPDDVVGGEPRQEAAVHEEDVLARQNVHAGHIFEVPRGHEGILRRIKERIGLGEIFGEACEGEKHVRGPNQGVDTLLGRGGVALYAAHRDFHPENALFSHLDEASVRGAAVRHDVKVVLREKFGPRSEHVAEPLGIAAFLVAHEDELHGELRRGAGLGEGTGQEKHAGESLLVVLDAAAVEHVAFPGHLPGIRIPEGRIAFGHHVHVGEKPEGAGGSAGDGGDEVRAFSAGDASVRCVHVLDAGNTHVPEPFFDESGLGSFTVSAVFGTDGAAGRQRSLDFRHVFGVRGDTLEKRFTFLGSHFLSSMAAKAPRLRNKKRRHEASFGKNCGMPPHRRRTAGRLMTLGSTLGSLQRVDLLGSSGFNLDVGGKVAAAAAPLAGRGGVAGAELFAFEFAHVAASLALVDDRGNHETIHHDAFVGLGGIL